MNKINYDEIRPFLLYGIVSSGMGLILLLILNTPKIALYNIDESSLPYIRLGTLSVLETGSALIILSLFSLLTGVRKKPNSENKEKLFPLAFNALIFSVLLLIIPTLVIEGLSNIQDKAFLVQNNYLAVFLITPTCYLFFLKVGVPLYSREKE